MFVHHNAMKPPLGSTSKNDPAPSVNSAEVEERAMPRGTYSPCSLPLDYTPFSTVLPCLPKKRSHPKTGVSHI